MVLTIGVMSFPMLVDRDVGAAVALKTSIEAVVVNPLTMAVWGVIVAALLVLGSIPAFLGLDRGAAGARPRHLAPLPPDGRCRGQSAAASPPAAASRPQRGRFPDQSLALAALNAVRRARPRDQSTIATARVQPAEPPRTFTGKQLTVNPVGGSASRLCSFSIWQ